MIRTALCEGGKVKVVDGFAEAKPKGFKWLYLSEPTKEEITQVAKTYKLSSSILEKFSKEPRSKRYSTTPLSFVLVDYFVENEKIESSRLLFILHGDTLITLTPKKSAYYDYLFNRVLEGLKLRREKASISWLLYEFLEEDIEDNYEVLHKTEELIIKMEEQATEFSGEVIPAKEIVRLKRDLFKMSRRFWASAKIVFLLRKGLTPVKLDQESVDLLDDVYDTFIHQIDVITTQQEMVSDILTIYTTKVSNEISRRVKKLTYITLVLTGITAVISIPNTFATIFGIPYFPRDLGVGEGVAWEFILAILFISTVISALFLYYYWKKQGLIEEAK